MVVLENAHVGSGTVRMAQPQEETGARLGREISLFSEVLEGVIACNASPQGKQQVLVKMEKTRMRQNPEQSPSRDFHAKARQSVNNCSQLWTRGWSSIAWYLALE